MSTKFDGLHDETFLYMEEDILKLYADFWGFMMLYSSALQIYHKEDVSTDLVMMNAERKARMQYRMMIASSKIYSRLKRNIILFHKINGSTECEVERI